MNEANLDLQELWRTQNLEDPDFRAIKKKPIQYPDMPRDRGLLFIGLNPSFSNKYISSALKKIPGNVLTVNDFEYKGLDFDNRPFIEFESYARGNYKSYFSPIETLSNYITGDMNNFNHIDLYAVRETKQQNIKDMIATHDDFFDRQMQIVIEIIRYLNPRMIVITNAFARERFDEIMTNYDEDHQKLFRTLGSLGTPVYSIGNLSGQRQLDKGTKEIIRRVLKTEWKSL